MWKDTGTRDLQARSSFWMWKSRFCIISWVFWFPDLSCPTYHKAAAAGGFLRRGIYRTLTGPLGSSRNLERENLSGLFHSCQIQIWLASLFLGYRSWAHMHNIIKIKYKCIVFFSSQQRYYNRLRRPNLTLVNDDDKNKGRCFVTSREPQPHCLHPHHSIENNGNWSK